MPRPLLTPKKRPAPAIRVLSPRALAAGTRVAFWNLGIKDRYEERVRARVRAWALCVGVLGGGDLGAAIHAHATWRRAATGPHVMTLGQLLGFASSIVLLMAAILVVVAAVRAAGRQRRLRRALQSARGRRDAGPSWIDPPS